METNAWILVGAALGACGLWLVTYRIRGGRLENNWPLFYYLGLVVYFNRMPLAFNAYALYVAVVSGLLLRFEFMNQRFAFAVKLVEAGCLLHICWRLGLAMLKAL